MVKYCECGCGQVVADDRRFVRGHHNKLCKGKTLVELYGEKRADAIKLEMSKSMKGKNVGTLIKKHGKDKAEKIKVRLGKGKTKEEIYGKDKAEEIKLKMSKASKGTLIERYGKDKAEEIKLKLGKGKTYEEIHGKDKAEEIKLKQSEKNTIWTKNNLINVLLEINKKRKITARSTLDKLHHYYDICGINTMRKLFGSTDNIAVLLGIEFEPNFCGKLGNTEKQILDNIEKDKNIILLRQHYIAGKYIDGYDKTNNVVYEVDEQHHKYQRVEDLIREDKIKEVLGCEFVRIKG